MEEVEEEWSRIGVVGRNIEELRLGVFDFGSLTVDMWVEDCLSASDLEKNPRTEGMIRR